MARLPLPDWLTLPEALAYLKGLGFGEDDSKQALFRACRDDRIRSRGRSMRWAGHNTQADLGGVAWDQAKADWQRSTLLRHRRSDQYEIADVELSRWHIDAWLGDAPASEAVEPPPAIAQGETLSKQQRAIAAYERRRDDGQLPEDFPKGRWALCQEIANEIGADATGVSKALKIIIDEDFPAP